MELIENDKAERTSLQQDPVNDDRKKFYSTGPGCVFVQVKMSLILKGTQDQAASSAIYVLTLLKLIY
jgi:hypothetical protein